MEWKEDKLGNVLFPKYGKDHKSLSDGNVPCYGSGGLMRYVEKPLAVGPSILIPRKGSLNNVMYVDGPFWTVDTMFWSQLDTEKIDPKYLFYSICKKDFASLNAGSAVPSMTVPILNEIAIKYPVKVEDQCRIASILSSLDRKIELNNQINKQLEEMAQAIFKSWFIDFEPFKDGEFVESELGRIPKGWRVGTLSEIAEINPSLKLTKGIEATYLDMSNMPTSGSFPANWEKKPYNGGMKFQKNDTLMARITPCLENGKVCYANFIEGDEVCFGSTEYIVMRPKNGEMPELLYFLCRDSQFVGYATKNMNGSSGRQRVSGETIGNYSLAIPPFDAICHLAPYFKSMMDKIRNNGLENRDLSTLRDTLLPKLMSGEINLEQYGNQ